MLAEAESSCRALAPGVVGIHLLLLSLKVANGVSGVAGDGFVDGAVRGVGGQHCHVARVLAFLVMMEMKITMVKMMMMTMIVIMMARTTTKLESWNSW